jgi:hypothetical protein
MYFMWPANHYFGIMRPSGQFAFETLGLGIINSLVLVDVAC